GEPEAAGRVRPGPPAAGEIGPPLRPEPRSRGDDRCLGASGEYPRGRGVARPARRTHAEDRPRHRGRSGHGGRARPAGAVPASGGSPGLSVVTAGGGTGITLRHEVVKATIRPWGEEETGSPTMDDQSNRFLEAFTAIEKHLRKILKPEKHVP